MSFSFEQQRQRLLPALVGAAVYQIVLVTLLIVASRMGGSSPVPEPVEFYMPSSTIVWLPEEGPGGGGGGGGNEMPEPPRLAELPGEDAVTIPVEEPPELAPTPPEEAEEPVQLAQLNIPATTLAAAADALPGMFEVPAGPPTPSQGTGSGGGAGTGSGSGIGPGAGSGLGPGMGGGTGGGIYRPGSGVTTPRVLREVKPQYTSDAMRARVQGTVWIECVVQPSGQCTNIEIVRSLDQNFGLDQQAVSAASQWRFAPGTRLGEPVPVLVTIELTFTLR